MAKHLSRSVSEKLLRSIEYHEKLDPEIADEVAHAMKEWAISLGATHFCHWFQPQRWSTAEKHDSFLSFDPEGNPIERFSGKQLIQSEPDASSFPSGGMRSTFEARGYTAWDPTSPAFLVKTRQGATLAIPSVYLAFTGEVLDLKTPLLRSLQALEENALRLLKRLGNTTAKYVRVTVGPEQEYFLISKEYYGRRPDLIYAGRTLLGGVCAKDQQMEDHYFGSIPSKVLDFMEELEATLYERGIPAKTRHNEVAPNQFEIAPLYEEANLSVDHNLQAMEIMRQVAHRQGLTILFHEKPFAGINGNGKHLNWSLMDSDGHNLLEPGADPKSSVQFLLFLSAILLGVHKNGSLLRAAIADAGNDHRLGANEAPPAVMSVYLGEFLNQLLEEIEKSGRKPRTCLPAIDHGLKNLPAITQDNSDRNRTSPLAFTGNKFEFRSVGGSQNCSEPATALNLIVAHGLEEVLKILERQPIKDGNPLEAALSTVQEVVRETARVRFEGNNYSPQWHRQARQRGLPIAKDTPAALKTLLEPGVIELFEKYRVLNRQELHAKYEIKLEAYVKTKEIELKLLKEIAQTYVLPALVRQINQFGEAAQHLSPGKSGSSRTRSGGKVLRERLSEAECILQKLYDGNDRIGEILVQSEKTDPPQKRAELLAEQGTKALEFLRQACDSAEEIIEHSLWPLPKYREMLAPL